jgi:predicted site-specific integrase-resolvase
MQAVDTQNMKIAEGAKILEMDASTLRGWARRGKLRGIAFRTGTDWRLRRAAFMNRLLEIDAGKRDRFEDQV